MTDVRPDPELSQRTLDEAEGLSVQPVTQWQLFSARFTRHRLAIAAVFVLSFMVLLAVFADFLPLENPTAQLEDETGRIVNLLSPRGDYWFGTDELGQDVFSRVMAGAHDILTVAPLATLVGLTLGTTVGLVAGSPPAAPASSDYRFHPGWHRISCRTGCRPPR